MLALANSANPLPPSGNLEGLFQEHHGQVFGAAYRVTGSSQDAEDVLQTVFLRLLRREDRLDLSPSPGAYLHRAAVNASLDLLRMRGRVSNVPVDELDVQSEDADPSRQQQSRELRQQLRQAILSLSPKSAEIFSLRFLEGLSNREIAQTLGMTQTAVGVTLHRARTQVKKELHTES